MITIKDLHSRDVLYWREDRPGAIGFDPERAHDLERTILDLHELKRLLARGCPPQTARAILR